MKKILTLMLINLMAISVAKEIELTLKVKAKYPMKVHYNFSNAVNTKNSYGAGDFDLTVNNEPQYVYVNQIPENDEVLVQVDKMNIKNRTVFNDPCEIKLSKNDLKAEITVGFTGDPKTHGSFTCFVSK